MEKARQEIQKILNLGLGDKLSIASIIVLPNRSKMTKLILLDSLLQEVCIMT